MLTLIPTLTVATEIGSLQTLGLVEGTGEFTVLGFWRI